MSLFVVDVGQEITYIHIPKTGGTSVRKGRQLSDCSVYAPLLHWPTLSLAFVRDPVDRLVSAYRDFRYLRPRFSLTFGGFVDQYTGPDWGDFEDLSSVHHHTISQTHPIHGLQYAQFIGRTSHLQADFNWFCEWVGIPPVELPRLRDSQKTEKVVVKREMRRAIAEKYKEDYIFLDKLTPGPQIP